MQPLFSQTTFNLSSSRTLLDLRCKQCQTVFQQPKHEIQKVLAGSENRTLDFCSEKCSCSHKDTRQTVHCHTCGAAITRSGPDIKKSKSGYFFCSCSCAAKWNNTHRSTGTRVSKLERWLSQKLTETYPDVEMHFNQKDTINGELDIYIPSFKLAFELNGVFHYEPIHGAEKLASIQSNDERKFQACLERGIELCIIDVSSMSHFKEHRAQIFLGIISSIINQKRHLVSSSQQQPLRLGDAT